MTYAVPFVWQGGESNSGLSLTATILDSSGASVASGLSGVTEIGSTGMYRWYYAAFTDGFVGFVEFLSGATVKTIFPISPADAAITPPSASDYTPARAAKLDLIGAIQISSGSRAQTGTVGKYNFTIEQGSSFSKVLTWLAEGVAVNVTGYTARLKVRNASSGAELLSMTTENGKIALGGAAGTITLTLTAAETALLAFTVAPYDLELVSSGGLVRRLFQGHITVSPEQTR